MRRYISLFLTIILLIPAALGALSEPTVEIDSHEENEVINNNVFTVTGTSQGSSGTILQTTKANFLQGNHVNSTATETGEVVIFPLPSVVKQNDGDPVLEKGAVGKFDDDLVSAPAVVMDGGAYHMWYTGNDENNNRIGYATSVDGIAWVRQNNGDFVLDTGLTGTWEHFGVSDPWVMKEGPTWRMWYTGTNGLRNKIGYADSADGINWNRNADPVLDLGPSGKFDSNSVFSPTIIKLGGTYHMFYMGYDGTKYKMGYATSSDGVAWARQNDGNAVFSAGTPGAFDGNEIRGPSVVYWNGVFKMYYSGFSGGSSSIGIAISANGIDWIRQNDGNAVLIPTNGKFDWKGVANPAVVLDGATERIWYSGENSTTVSLGYATAVMSVVAGTYTSPPFEIGGDVQFGKINWTVNQPAGTTIGLEVRTEQKTKTWGNWFTPTNGADLDAPDGWRFQYKVSLTSDDIAKTPEFKDITLAFFKPIAKVEVSVNNGVMWTTCQGTEIWTCDVEAADGQRMIIARSVDSTGDHSEVKRVNVTVNGDLPVGSIQINDGAKYTSSRDVDLKINASDSTGVHNMMVSEDRNFTGTSWIAYSVQRTFTLSEGDGFKNVYIKFMDTYGIESNIYNDSIILDETPPKGSISINDGAAYTTSREVTLKLAASDINGITGMIISEDPTFLGLSPSVFYHTEFFTLSSKDALKTVYVRYFDASGSYGDYSANITLDTTEPTGSIKINSNAAVTITRMVNISIEGKDKNDVTEMILCNQDSFENCTWEPYADHKIWELPGTGGDKVVFIKFLDTAGLESDTYFDSIVYEVPVAEGIISINDGALYTNMTNVTLTIGIGDIGTVTEMMVSNDPKFTDAQWESHSDKREWFLTEGDGLKYVYIKFLTMAGIETEAFSDNITLDSMVPEVKVTLPANGTASKVSQVDLTIRATDSKGVQKVEVQVDGIGWEEAIQNETDDAVWTITVDLPSKGPHTITVRATDKAGNIAEDRLEVSYKPKKKEDSPFMDGGLILVALALGLVIISRRTRRR